MAELLAPTSARMWTDAQRAAIEARGRTLVAAAAGSGKTSVLTELVVEALVAREVAPSEVCAVTFTEKAAQEMRGRIADRLANLGEHDLLAELELARIGTIHSLCAAVLRMHGTAVGVDPRAGVLDEAQHAWILREAIARAIDDHTAAADVHWLRARMGDERIATLLGGIYRCAAGGTGDVRLPAGEELELPLDPKSAEVLVAPADARRAMAATTALWVAVRDRVLERKQQLGRISFDDLERLAVEAVRRDEVRTALRARWTMVLVDEFQDTNERQYELLDSIGGDRLFMVGDEWQSIYRFRGADVDVFRSRRVDGSASVLPMRENFRSGAPVLDVVNRLFGAAELFGDRYEPVLPGTDHQRAADPPGVELLVVPTSGTMGIAPDRGAREREAMRVAERIAELVESGDAEPGDIALLYARGTGMDQYESALRAWGLPVLRGASGGYYDQRDVRDALALLALVRNHADDTAALGVLAGPVGRLAWRELHEATSSARERRESLLAAATRLGSPGARRVAELAAELRELASRGSLVELVARTTTLPELQVGAGLEHDGVVRVANLRRLVELAASAEQVGVADVAGFLEFVAAQRRDARVGEASVADETVGAVRMMTIHAAKGLEFPWVFVVEAGQSGTTRTESVPRPLTCPDGTTHVALPLRDGRCVRTPPLERAAGEDAHAQAEESLRLWYVAATRARTGLVISGRWNFTPTSTGRPRAVVGALRWLRSVLQLEEDFGGADQRSLVLDGLVTVDTRAAARTPVRVWHGDEQAQLLATPIPIEDVDPSGDGAASEAAVVEPHALQQALRDAIATTRVDEWRQLDGTRLHDAVARLLDAARAGTPVADLLDPSAGVWMTGAVRTRLAPVVASPTFQQLVAASARSEVPYVATTGALVASRAADGVRIAASGADVDAGRMDALAVRPDGSWWIVDWKRTLPDTAAAAWAEHRTQLERYAEAARLAGAPACTVTLVALDSPERTWDWAGGVEATPPG